MMYLFLFLLGVIWGILTTLFTKSIIRIISGMINWDKRKLRKQRKQAIQDLEKFINKDDRDDTSAYF